MMVDAGHCCSLHADEWLIAHDDFEYSIVSPTKNAALRITAYDCGRNVTIDELIEMANNRVGGSAEVVESNCGQFAGVAFWANKDDRPSHAWYVTLAEILLLIELRCEDGNMDEHMEAATLILASLRDARP